MAADEEIRNLERDIKLGTASTSDWDRYVILRERVGRPVGVFLSQNQPKTVTQCKISDKIQYEFRRNSREQQELFKALPALTRADYILEVIEELEPGAPLWLELFNSVLFKMSGQQLRHPKKLWMGLFKKMLARLDYQPSLDDWNRFIFYDVLLLCGEFLTRKVIFESPWSHLGFPSFERFPSLWDCDDLHQIIPKSTT